MKTVLKMLAICMMAGGLGVQSVYAEPLVIQEQGSFSAGGTIITAPGTFDAKKPLDSAGQTYHGDHASVFYQIPENPHKYPIVMLHGAGQSSRTWESTPDGREGFQNIFLRRGFSTYIVDQPRRGDAGRTTVEGTVTPKPDGFNIKLNDCDTNVSSNAAVAFLGTTVTSNDDTLALQSSAAGSAQNVGIQILDRTGEVLVLDGATFSAKTDLIDVCHYPTAFFHAR